MVILYKYIFAFAYAYVNTNAGTWVVGFAACDGIVFQPIIDFTQYFFVINFLYSQDFKLSRILILPYFFNK